MLFWMLGGVLLMSGLVFFGVAWAWATPRLERFRIRPEQSRKVVGRKLWLRVFGNMVMSSSLVIAMTLGAAPWMLDESMSFGWRALFDAVAVLLVYDFFYYWLHRWAFHRTTWLKKVHAVHHVIRSPTAIESLYLHPVETFLGQALLTTVALAWGPIAFGTWILILGVHSVLNIVVHAGLDIPVLGLRSLSYLSRKHAIHHISMRGGNYASLTPLWDLMFGTAE